MDHSSAADEETEEPNWRRPKDNKSDDSQCYQMLNKK